MQFLKEFMSLESIFWLSSPLQCVTIRFMKKFSLVGLFGTQRSPRTEYLFLYAPAASDVGRWSGGTAYIDVFWSFVNLTVSMFEWILYCWIRSPRLRLA